MTLRVLELFAGIGGAALAWERLGFEHVAFVEVFLDLVSRYWYCSCEVT